MIKIRYFSLFSFLILTISLSASFVEAQVRKAGVASVNKSFLNKSDADRWAKQIEAAIEIGETTPSHQRLLCL